MISDTDKSRLQVGFKQVIKAIGEGRAEKVFLAEDADDSICTQIKTLSDEHGTELVYADTMRELGHMCNIEVKASCAVVLK